MTNHELAVALAAIVKDLRSSRFHICSSCGVPDDEYAERLGAQATATECADKLEPLLTALRAAPEGWRDIESAPKDGTWVLAWPCYSEGVHRVRWGGKRPPCWQDFMGRVPKPPTHWQSLPEPPK